MKFIVTDPCYLINSNSVWHEFCSLWFEDKATAAEKVISNAVGTAVSISDTGFGDWTNHLYGEGVIESEFFADAGMVCVCELTDTIEKTLVKKYRHVLGAVFEASGIADIEFDRSNSNWTVVRIVTEDGHVLESDGYEYDDEDDEDDED